MAPAACHGQARLGSGPPCLTSTAKPLFPAFLYPLLFVPLIWHSKCFVFLVAFPEFTQPSLLAHASAVCSLGAVFKGRLHFFFFLAWLPRLFVTLNTHCLSMAAQALASGRGLVLPSHPVDVWYLMNHTGVFFSETC